MSARHILLLHGLGVDHRMWSPVLACLQEKGHVLVPDLPGFGDSPPLSMEACTPVHYTEHLSRWLAGLGTGPVALAGYSMGGTLAMLLALRHPEQVERLVVCCSSACWGHGVRRWLARLFAGVGRRAAMEVFQASVRWGCGRFAADQGERRAIRDMVARAHRPTMLRLYMELAGLDLVPRLGELNLPVSVIGGSRDWLAPPAHQRLLRNGLPCAHLDILSGAGHLLCLSHAEVFAEHLVRALCAAD